MQSQLGTMMTILVVDAQQKNLGASMVTINEDKSGGGTGINQLMVEPAAAVSEQVDFTNYLEELMVSLNGGASLKGQAKTEPADGTKVRSPGPNQTIADNLETKSAQV